MPTPHATNNVTLQEAKLFLPLVRFGDSAATEEVTPVLRSPLPVNTLP